VGAALTLRDVRQLRGGREVLRIDALDLGAGERLAVLGPNGAGKTTLLRLLAAIDMPTAGTVLVDGVRTTPGAVALRRRIAYATQRPGLLSTSVRRNVELPLGWRGVPRPQRRAAAAAALERLGVAQLADRRAAALSVGEAQRVNLARALALDPSLLLLDEPAAALDAEARQAFLSDVERALGASTTTVVHVSHRPEEAFRLADRVAALADGVIRQLATPETLLREPADATVARVVGYENVLEAEIGPAGVVAVGGWTTGLRASGDGPAIVAVWAAGVQLGPAGSEGIPARVERVTPGPGRWELALAGPLPLRAHVPLSASPPRAGEPVAVMLDPALATVVASPRHASCVRAAPASSACSPS
jgi:ABC-type Fe3+/spermidine/putrescine transport system ATPase subunit